MPQTYQTPGVYVEEIPKLPPSVAEVSTAVPAFIGATRTGAASAGPVLARITTLLEFEERFGGPKPVSYLIKRDAAGAVASVTRLGSGQNDKLLPEYPLYYAVSHYFKNGGGPCYIVSVGDDSKQPDKAAIEAGLRLLKEEDEPTLIVLTDAINLKSADYYELCAAALALCNTMQDRFTLLDVKQDAASSLDSTDPEKGKTDVEIFRNKIGTQYLSYGAAYYPYLRTTLTYAYEEAGVYLQPPWAKDLDNGTVTVSFNAPAASAPKVSVTIDASTTGITFVTSDTELKITFKEKATGKEVVEAWNTWLKQATSNARGFEISALGDGSGQLKALTASSLGPGETLETLRTKDSALYNQIRARLASERVVLPASAAMAGIYASMDRDRGVWRAPANVSVSAVIGPVLKITQEAQADLNVHAASGKSINAIRSFAGRGTLVWGARTLAGNDNEWRYVPVRRLFIMVEESAKKATAFAVFEPNDMTTWLKVKGMIESFLYGLWERGALAGSKPESAYFVNVGLGKTMTTDDILNGRMKVEIGLAAVRPAEFIILRFSHKLQEA